MTSRVRARVEIAAPIEDVFAFFDDLANAAALNPQLVEITKVEPVASGGRRVEYRTRGRGGDEYDASSEHVEYDPPHRTVTRGLQSGVATTATRDFEPTAHGTLVNATIEWSVPVRYVARLVERPLRRPLHQGLRRALAAAREHFETTGDETARG